MHHFLIYTLYILSGVCLYAVINHLNTGFNRPIEAVHIVFSFIAFFIGCAAISWTFVIQSQTPSQFLTALRWNIEFSLTVILLIPWFIKFYTHKLRFFYLFLSSLVVISLLVANFFLPNTLMYDHFQTISHLTLPWGETITRGVGSHNFKLTMIVIGFFILVFGNAISTFLKKYKDSLKMVDLYMALGFIVFSISIGFGMAARFSVIHYSSPGIFSFFIIIILMSFSLREEKENLIRASEKKFRTLIEESPIGILFTNNGIVIDANPTFINMYGYAIDEIQGNSANHFIQFPENTQTNYKKITNLGIRPGKNYSLTGIKKDGTTFPIYLTMKQIEINHQRMTIYFVIDQTWQQESKKKIERLSLYDSVTGLPNRRYMIAHLNELLQEASSNHQYGAFIMFDLNNFRILNDSLGHDTGDLLLQQIGTRLKANLQNSNLVARIGGDEFAVLINHIGDQADQAATHAKSIASDILNKLDQPYHLKNREYRSTISCGITIFGDTSTPVKQLLMQAEMAMYQAKKNRYSNATIFNTSMDHLLRNRIDFELDLRKAIEQKDIFFHYQIQVNELGQAIGAEALVRWDHKEKGLISPDQFIPFAEETGLILPLGESLLDLACSQLKEWSLNPISTHLILAVNISAKQFHHPNFVDTVRRHIEKYQINPTLLKFELTESMLFEKLDQTIEKISFLKKLGIKFALDDFGTGYSSIQYLKYLPLDELKIDQSFVRDIAHSNSDQAIIKTIIAMAHSLNLNLIAEGVENTTQLQFLFESGCEHYQGYLFGKPLKNLDFINQLDYVRASPFRPK